MHKQVLNVGGGPSRDLPPIYSQYKQVLLDIDPDVKPDIVCDARLMKTLPKAEFDVVYCSHTLEHFYKYEVKEVLDGFFHVLKRDGFAHIAVPNMQMLFDTLVSGKKDINDVWYDSSGGPITFHEVIYGWNAQLDRGNHYYAHKSGFTSKALSAALGNSGFQYGILGADPHGNLIAYAFKSEPPKAKLKKLGLCP